MTDSTRPFTTNLLINIDHVATLRNARHETFPDPIHAAILAETAGADGIVFHLREDQRHITERDVRLLKETVTTKLDFELSTNEEIVRLCSEIKPHLATLVPERREEVTTEKGLDVVGHRERLRDITSRLFDAGIEEVAFFLDPDLEQIEVAREVGANCIELHTGAFASATTEETRLGVAERLAIAAEKANELGLRVHAGHGLDYHNYPLFQRRVPHIREVSIGFAVIARAMLVGFEKAVQEMLRIVKGH